MPDAVTVKAAVCPSVTVASAGWVTMDGPVLEFCSSDREVAPPPHPLSNIDNAHNATSTLIKRVRNGSFLPLAVNTAYFRVSAKLYTPAARIGGRTLLTEKVSPRLIPAQVQTVTSSRYKNLASPRQVAFCGQSSRMRERVSTEIARTSACPSSTYEVRITAIVLRNGVIPARLFSIRCVNYRNPPAGFYMTQRPLAYRVQIPVRN